MDGDLVIFLLVGIVPPKPIHTGKSCGSINFLSQSEYLILLHETSPARLYLLDSFFVWHSGIMIETYRISFGY